MTFLKKVAGEILKNHPENLSEICAVFPNRRSCIYFKEYISMQIDKPVWIPAALSIDDFVASLSPFSVPDRLYLIAMLHSIYSGFHNDETFGNFYAWGDLLLKDFDEIDKELVDVNRFFPLLVDLRETENKFSFTPSELKVLKNYWEAFGTTEREYQKRFLNIWRLNEKIYKKLKSDLEKQNLETKGGQYRKLAEAIKQGSPGINWSKIYFCGFNALSKAEHVIISELVKDKKASVIWDADTYYLGDKQQEAGYFLRKNFTVPAFKPDTEWIESLLEKKTKNIKIYATPTRVDQAKALGSIMEAHGLKPSKTAVVLPDENLLMPVLYSIPNEYEDINVTMGYPLGSAPLYYLLESLINLQKTLKETSHSEIFYYKYIVEVLSHPYIQRCEVRNADRLKRKIIENKMAFIGPKIIFEAYESGIFHNIFKPAKTYNELFDYLKAIILKLSEQIYQKDEFERICFHQFYSTLNKLESTINAFNINFNIEDFWLLFKRLTIFQRIPFDGEPLKGLQIMGLLETRNLDFENVCILSMNEGIIPKNNAGQTYIPFSVRKAFGMNNYEEEDALYSYYFYRLLQRAKNVFLFYTTDARKTQTGEKSRFLLQIENELVKKNPKIKLEEYQFKSSILPQDQKSIEIQKDDEVLDLLQRYIVDEDGNSKAFSPSSLITYLSCSLQFYFKYVAKLDEKEEIPEEIDPLTFGRIFHDAAEAVYKDFLEKGTYVTEPDIKKIKTKVTSKISEAFETHFPTGDTQNPGKYRLNLFVIHHLIDVILNRDIEQRKFKIIGLEDDTNEVSFPVKYKDKDVKARLKGKIDRIDKEYGKIKIIDYKTGSISIYRNAPNEDLIENASHHKTAFQLMCYGLLYIENHPVNEIDLTAIPLKEVHSNIWPLTKKREDFSEFKEILKEKINEIFDSDTPFSQTVDQKTCRFCTFKEICHR